MGVGDDGEDFPPLGLSWMNDLVAICRNEFKNPKESVDDLPILDSEVLQEVFDGS